jgi:hypothetical protein
MPSGGWVHSSRDERHLARTARRKAGGWGRPVAGNATASQDAGPGVLAPAVPGLSSGPQPAPQRRPAPRRRTFPSAPLQWDAWPTVRITAHVDRVNLRGSIPREPLVPMGHRGRTRNPASAPAVVAVTCGGPALPTLHCRTPRASSRARPIWMSIPDPRVPSTAAGAFPPSGCRRARCGHPQTVATRPPPGRPAAAFLSRRWWGPRIRRCHPAHRARRLNLSPPSRVPWIRARGQGR